MTVQLSRDVKIFITDNVDTNGNILITGILPSNTVELIIQQNTLDYVQSVTNDFINFSNLIDTPSYLDTFVNTNTEIGKCSFNTLLNTITGDMPYDAMLWNNLVNSSNSFSGMWALNPSFKTMNLIRTTSTLNTFGIIVLLNGTAYLMHGCRVNSAGVSFNIDAINTTSWNVDFMRLESLAADYTLTSSLFTLNGSLAGTINKCDWISYTLSTGRGVKIGISPTGLSTPLTALPSLGLSLNFSNSLGYIANNLIDKIDTRSIFTQTDAYSITGSTSVYTRMPGDSISTLLDTIRDNQGSVSNQQLYRIFIEVPVSGTNVVEITLDGCLITSNIKMDTVMTSLIDFTIVNGTNSSNCAIKFYS